MEYAARIAPEIDRLVLAVNRLADAAVRDEVGERTAALGLDTPASLAHYAEFLLAGALDEELVPLRLPYLDRQVLDARVGRWVRLGLATRAGSSLSASAGLAPILRSILDARARVARTLWSRRPEFEQVVSPVETLVAAIPDRFVLAAAHRRLPAPADAFLRFHHRLTTLRYVRSRSHVEAWESHGLDAPAMVAMTAWWRGDRADPGPGLDLLVERGLADPGGLTVAGTRLRDAIETETNRATGPVFEILDEDVREQVLVSLARLPGSPD